MSRVIKLGRTGRRRARENPRGRKLKVELRQEGGYWSVYVNGSRTVDRESFAVADRIKQELERPSTRHTEAGEVAESIRRHFAKNPHRRIRSTARRPLYGMRRLRGRARVSMTGGALGDANFHVVQVRRGAKWITLAGFPLGEFGKARATEYGKLLARRYPRQSFRVFWPDTLRIRQAGAWSGMPPRVTPARKNPAPRSLSIPEQHQLKIARQTLKMPDAMVGVMGGPTKAQAREIVRRLTRRKNPAPRVRADGAEVERAARLFTAFTGHRVTKMRQVSLPAVKVGLAIGPVLEIAYETTRDGKRENYLHKFRRGARPLLASSQDGRTLMLLGGGHRFTPRGIVDRA